MRYFLRTRWAMLALVLAFLAFPALLAPAAAKQRASPVGSEAGLQAPVELGGAAETHTEHSSNSLLAASFFLLVFVLIALANLAIFRSGRRRWRKSAGLSSGGGFGGFGGGFSGFGSDTAAGRETGLLR